MCEATAQGNDNKETTTDFTVILYMDYTGPTSQGGGAQSDEQSGFVETKGVCHTNRH